MPSTKTTTKRTAKTPGAAAAKQAKGKDPKPSAATKDVAPAKKYVVRKVGTNTFATVDLTTGKRVSAEFPTIDRAQEDCNVRNSWGNGKRPTAKVAKSAAKSKPAAKTAKSPATTKEAKSSKRVRHPDGPGRGDPKLAAGDPSIKGATVRVIDGPSKGTTGTLARFHKSQGKYPIWTIRKADGALINQIAHRLEVTAAPPTAA